MSELTDVLALFMLAGYIACCLAYLDPIKRDVIGVVYLIVIKYVWIPIIALLWI